MRMSVHASIVPTMLDGVPMSAATSCTISTGYAFGRPVITHDSQPSDAGLRWLHRVRVLVSAGVAHGHAREATLTPSGLDDARGARWVAVAPELPGAAARSRQADGIRVVERMPLAFSTLSPLRFGLCLSDDVDRLRSGTLLTDDHLLVLISFLEQLKNARVSLGHDLFDAYLTSSNDLLNSLGV